MPSSCGSRISRRCSAIRTTCTRSRVTVVFSSAVTFFGLAISLLLAVMADRVIRGAGSTRPCCCGPTRSPRPSPACCGASCSTPASASSPICSPLGYEWNYVLNGGQALLLVIVAATWKQISYNFLFFLAGLQSIPKSLIEAAAIDGAGPGRRFWTIVLPLLSPTAFFLLVVNIVYAFFQTFGIIHAVTQGGPAKATEILVLQGLQRRLPRPRSRRLGGAVGRADGDRDRADGDPVPLDRAQGALLRCNGREPALADLRGARGAGARRAGRRLSRLHDLRRLDARPGACCPAPVPLLPGRTFVENYRTVLFSGLGASSSVAAGRADDAQQPGHGARHRARQDRDLDHLRPMRSSISSFRCG